MSNDTNETLPDPYRRRVTFIAHRTYDVEVHVSEVEIEDKKYADIREFIVSLQQYGRGIIIPVTLAGAVGKAVADIGEEPTDGGDTI